MLMTELIPESFRPVWTRTHRVFEKTWIVRIETWVYGEIANLLSSRSDVHQYWRHVTDADNSPELYLGGAVRSQFLVEIVKKYAKPNAKILEIGCNVGRNLNHLFQAGFVDLSGIEINERAVQLFKQSFPETADHTAIYNAPVEESIGHFGNGEFDIVFTMAVLEHIHRDSTWILPEIVRIVRDFLVTIEDERSLTERHFPRNYKRVFESLGMKQIEEMRCNEIDGLGSGFYARVFAKR